MPRKQLYEFPSGENFPRSLSGVSKVVASASDLLFTIKKGKVALKWREPVDFETPHVSS